MNVKSSLHSGIPPLTHSSLTQHLACEFSVGTVKRGSIIYQQRLTSESMKKSLLLYKSNQLIAEQLYFLPTIELVCGAVFFKAQKELFSEGGRFMKCNIAVSSFGSGLSSHQSMKTLMKNLVLCSLSVPPSSGTELQN